MSRKSDIELAWRVSFRAVNHDDGIQAALEAAYDLGRAAQAETDITYSKTMVDVARLACLSKGLRAKVRKAGEEK